MSVSESPRTASELCDWLEANVSTVREAIRQAKPDQWESFRLRWSGVVLRLSNADLGAEFDDLFRSFLHALLSLPSVVDILPSGFNDYLLLGGRRPTQREALEICDKFKKTIPLIHNDDVEVDDPPADRVGLAALSGTVAARPVVSGSAVSEESRR